MTVTSTVSQTPVNPGQWIAERHERDVTAILAALRTPEHVVSAVVDAAFDITLRRGDTTPEARGEFASWSRHVLRAAHDRTALDGSSKFSAPLTALLRTYSDIARSPGTTPETVAGLIAATNNTVDGVLDEHEQLVADLVAGVLVGSVEMWSAPHGPAAHGSAEKKKSIDKSEVVDADVMGAITGAAGAAISTAWSGGVLTGPAVAVASATGAVLGSAVDAVMQDTAINQNQDADPDE